jgi:hypothetical protein
VVSELFRMGICGWISLDAWVFGFVGECHVPNTITVPPIINPITPLISLPIISFLCVPINNLVIKN